MKLSNLKGIYTTIELPNELRTIFSETADAETRAQLIDIQHDLETTLNLSYDITSDAVDAILSEIPEYEIDAASVYTAVQLSYINIYNQQEISDIFKEYQTRDIAQAAAIWHNNKVTEAYKAIKALLEDETE